MGRVPLEKLSRHVVVTSNVSQRGSTVLAYQLPRVGSGIAGPGEVLAVDPGLARFGLDR